MGGKDRYQPKFQNKTPQPYRQGRNEESCDTKSGVTGITIIVEPVVVPVPRPIIVTIEVQGVAVAVRVAKYCVRRHLFHHPLKFLGDLRIESYSAS